MDVQFIIYWKLPVGDGVPDGDGDDGDSDVLDVPRALRE